MFASAHGSIRCFLGISTGNHGVFQGYRYLYPQNTYTRAEGEGICGLGLEGQKTPTGTDDELYDERIW
jgi:hypothetical protein